MELNLNNGERSVGATLLHCTKDQLWRYIEALDWISKKDEVLDLGCGCGYGSYILSNKAKKVTGIDYCEGIIAFANKFYKKENIDFIYEDGVNVSDKYDVVVAFETIEHFKDANKIFEVLGKITSKKIILTVPHISVPNNNRFHYRHFSEEDIKKFLENINFKIEKLIMPQFQGGKAIFVVANRKK